MTIEETLESGFVLILAWANAANDISKGVATLLHNFGGDLQNFSGS